MKREIKFRVWNNRDKKMLNVAGAEFISGREIMSAGTLLPDEVVYGKNNGGYFSPMMQYTGLHDKNGREIYEGDLFEHRFGYMVFDDVIHDEMGTEYGVVVLEDGQFGVKIPALGVYNLYGLLLRNGHLDDMPKDDLFVMKIAGNIHDNPELLEAEK